jgi:hypothetical protein
VKKLFLQILFPALALSAFSQSQSDFPYWLKGLWEIRSETGSSYEEWKSAGDGTLTGKTFRMFNQDTIVFDTMRISYFDSAIVYQMSANVKSTGIYARFTLQKPDPALWVFENLQTDYPKNINYMRMGNDSVYVWTEAKNADNACMDYLMIRLKK